MSTANDANIPGVPVFSRAEGGFCLCKDLGHLLIRILGVLVILVFAGFGCLLFDQTCESVRQGSAAEVSCSEASCVLGHARTDTLQDVRSCSGALTCDFGHLVVAEDVVFRTKVVRCLRGVLAFIQFDRQVPDRFGPVGFVRRQRERDFRHEVFFLLHSPLAVFEVSPVLLVAQVALAGLSVLCSRKASTPRVPGCADKYVSARGNVGR